MVQERSSTEQARYEDSCVSEVAHCKKGSQGSPPPVLWTHMYSNKLIHSETRSSLILLWIKKGRRSSMPAKCGWLNKVWLLYSKLSQRVDHCCSNWAQYLWSAHCSDLSITWGWIERSLKENLLGEELMDHLLYYNSSRVLRLDEKVTFLVVRSKGSVLKGYAIYTFLLGWYPGTCA